MYEIELYITRPWVGFTGTVHSTAEIVYSKVKEYTQQLKLCKARLERTLNRSNISVQKGSRVHTTDVKLVYTQQLK